MSKMRVLIVEDDTDILQLLSYNLQASGFGILTSKDGFDALKVEIGRASCRERV